MRKLVLMMLMVAVLGFGIYGIAHANLIADGGFEQPIAGPGGYNSGYLLFNVGNTIDSVWTVVGSSSGNVAVVPSSEYTVNNVYFTAEEGSQSLDLTGNTDNGSSTGVSQTISTSPGTLYTLSFYVGDLYNDPSYPYNPGIATVIVDLNGALFQTASNSNSSGLSPNWELFSYTFTPTGSSTTLSFINGTASGAGLNGLDNVQVTANTAVPEPCTMFLLGTGLIGLVGLRRKFKK